MDKKPKFKKGQKVECIKQPNDDKRNHYEFGGYGYEPGKVFVVNQIRDSFTDIVYFPVTESGVFERALRSFNLEEIKKKKNRIKLKFLK